MKQHLLVETWKGLTPLGLMAVIGLGGFGIARTALMVGCHISQPYAECTAERSDWQKQMAMIAGGFWLLYTRAPGTSDAPANTTVQALPPWRRPEDQTEPAPPPGEPDPDPLPIVPADLPELPPPASPVINPDAPDDHELTAAERMDRAARRLRGAGR